MSMAKKMGIKYKIAKLNKLRKRRLHEETNSDDPTVCNVEFDRNQIVNSDVLDKMDEATKSLGIYLENGSKHIAPLETIEQLSMEESLEVYEKIYRSKEPEDPEEREKRKQIEAQIEKRLYIFEDLIDSSIDNEEKSKICEDLLISSDEDPLDNLPTIQTEGLNADVAGSSTAFGEHEIGNDEDMKVLHNWAK